MKTEYLWLLSPMLLSACFSSDQKSVPASRGPAAEISTNFLEGVELKRLTDMEQRLKTVAPAGIDDYAQAIAEVDEWLYVPADEKPAREKIDSAIDTLRTRIEEAVRLLSKAALDALNGKTATEKMSKINSLLSLYPAPKTAAHRAKLEQLTSSILSTSRRVEDIRRLRYNEWAISQIQAGLEGYRNELKMKGIADVKKLVTTNKEVLVNICINSMSTIDPGFLEPAVIDLYSYVFGLTRDAMGSDDGSRLKLAKGFSNPRTKRKTPIEF